MMSLPQGSARLEGVQVVAWALERFATPQVCVNQLHDDWSTRETVYEGIRRAARYYAGGICNGPAVGHAENSFVTGGLIACEAARLTVGEDSLLNVVTSESVVGLSNPVSLPPRASADQRVRRLQAESSIGWVEHPEVRTPVRVVCEYIETTTRSRAAATMLALGAGWTLARIDSERRRAAATVVLE